MLHANINDRAVDALSSPIFRIFNEPSFPPLFRRREQSPVEQLIGVESWEDIPERLKTILEIAERATEEVKKYGIEQVFLNYDLKAASLLFFLRPQLEEFLQKGILFSEREELDELYFIQSEQNDFTGLFEIDDEGFEEIEWLESPVFIGRIGTIALVQVGNEPGSNDPFVAKAYDFTLRPFPFSSFFKFMQDDDIDINSEAIVR
ncbi:MAG: hypothetical protein SAJ12_21680 [Jaaginema sp. PMC 1079.18]|nr:hypothetical protein [Jaaginema sp. PMC 1080.18]MEC4853600.1 hypothetical protein [Jaaginema sp. PMC 1079.18]MEC4867015.1 hypothetical protein [Jaaginema sp. PMC 1078.18]